jgi:hypothetical protein
MTRRSLFAPLVALALLPNVFAHAQDPNVATDEACDDTVSGEPKPNIFKRAWMSVCRDFKRNNNWPDPFVTADRLTTRIPFDVCTANGWRIQNTLSDHHFEDDSTKLTEAGRLKVSAIINESPVAYRAIFILRDVDPSITAGRIGSVQEAVSVVLGDRPPVPIFETYEKPRGTSAMYVDEVTRRYQATIPDPRIPTDESSTSTGSGSSGSGAPGP